MALTSTFMLIASLPNFTIIGKNQPIIRTIFDGDKMNKMNALSILPKAL